MKRATQCGNGSRRRAKCSGLRPLVTVTAAKEKRSNDRDDLNVAALAVVVAYTKVSVGVDLGIDAKQPCRQRGTRA